MERSDEAQGAAPLVRRKPRGTDVTRPATEEQNTMTSFTTLFLSHGSPMMVLEDTPARRFLLELGHRIEKPKAVLAMSAHWPSRVPVVGCAAWPAKINDMHGFPQALYDMTYAPPGAPQMAARAADLLGEATRRDPGAGIDPCARLRHEAGPGAGPGPDHHHQPFRPRRQGCARSRQAARQREGISNKYQVTSGR